MFSTRLVDNRYYVPCVVLTEVPIVHSFIVDTGAKYTCCSYKSVDMKLREEDFVQAPKKVLGGIVSGAEIQFYAYKCRQFTIGNISMGERILWITFDRLATDDVLGMDILQDITFIGDGGTKEMRFEAVGIQ